jgi:hypothetical protein
MFKKYILVSLFTILITPVLVSAQAGETATNTIALATTTDTVVEDIVIISEAYKNLDDKARQVESEIRLEFRNGIDKAITEIRAQDDIEAYILQRAVDESRENAYSTLRSTFNESAPTDVSVIQNVKSIVLSSIEDIELSLETISTIEVDMSNISERVDTILTDFTETVEENNRVISERDGQLINTDSDNDGISDYDETYIFNTDPNNESTTGGGLSDAEKIEQGIDPTSPTLEPIQFEDPREENEAAISDLYTVEEVRLDEESRNVVMRGKALPNSYITLYIYSTPVIVSVKTDNRGEWVYTLDKELENGEHEIHVATVNNSGKLLARSNPVAFTQTDTAAALGAFASIGDTPASGTGNFFQDNFVLIVVSIVLLAILITISLFGRNPKTAVPEDQLK